jgi:hypothetical protein
LDDVASAAIRSHWPPTMRTRQSLPIRLPYEFATSITVGVTPACNRASRDQSAEYLQFQFCFR